MRDITNSNQEGKSFKFLGEFSDPRLQWNDHIDTVASSLSKGLFVLLYLKAYLLSSLGICSSSLGTFIWGFREYLVYSVET